MPRICVCVCVVYTPDDDVRTIYYCSVVTLFVLYLLLIVTRYQLFVFSSRGLASSRSTDEEIGEKPSRRKILFPAATVNARTKLVRTVSVKSRIQSILAGDADKT